MFKVVITGPECSGKTTLAADIARMMSVDYLPEYAREYLSNLDRPYNEADIVKIAREQANRESEYQASDLLICDTSLLVLKIWSQVRYGRVDPIIFALLDKMKPDLYLLPDFDIPYEEDPLREHPAHRGTLHKLYVSELKTMGIPWVSLTGDHLERARLAVNKIETLITTKS